MKYILSCCNLSIKYDLRLTYFKSVSINCVNILSNSLFNATLRLHDKTNIELSLRQRTRSIETIFSQPYDIVKLATTAFIFSFDTQGLHNP